MIARYTYLGRARAFPAGFLLALAVAGPARAASPAADPPVATTAVPAQAGAAPKQADQPIPEPIARAIAVLRATEIKDYKRWGQAIRALAQIGQPAVPPLIEELDRTTETRALGYLAFAMRAIGDPRAVPALIRAIPRTLVDNAGDFGLMVYDVELLRFLQRHDTTPGAHGLQFAFGTPFHEITGALHALTGQKFDIEAELHFVGLQGSPKQRWLKLWLFHDLAARWTVWWKQNWRRFTDDPAYSRISLPPLPAAPRVAAMTAAQPFPTGNRVLVLHGPINAIVGPPPPEPGPDEYYRTFMDLDTGRERAWPRNLPDPAKVKDDEIAAFAAREGFDLRGTTYTAQGSGRSCYVIQGLGLRAWQIDNARYHTIEDELRDGKPPKLDRPSGDLLIDFDPRTGTFHPENKATFLFVTRDGTAGALQLNGQVTELSRPGDRARFRPDPPEEPGKPAQLQSVRGAYRGVQFTYKFLYEEENDKQN